MTYSHLPQWAIRLSTDLAKLKSHTSTAPISKNPQIMPSPLAESAAVSEIGSTNPSSSPFLSYTGIFIHHLTAFS